MSLKDRLDKVFDVKSYGYVVNKWFLRVAFILMILLFGVVSVVDGWDVAFGGSTYVCCDGSCVNPVTGALMFDGETYGVEPSLFARSFSFVCVLLFGFALLLNHLVYNKNFWSVKK